MALTAQDFEKGKDFTGLVFANAADHNVLVDDAAPVSNSATEGKGIIVWTRDSALNTPTVPSASTITKWKRYIWLRVPHASAASLIPIAYGWNDSLASDPTFDKWTPIGVDITQIEADIAQLQIDLANVLALANSALVTANNAVNLANNALTNAANAQTTADAAAILATTADTNATQALTDALAAKTAADAAALTAATAQTTATNANNTATTALAQANPIQVSAEYDIVNGLCAEFAHGLGITPKYIQWVIVCKVIQANYAVNDEIVISNTAAAAASGTVFSEFKNATNIGVVYGNGLNINIINKTTGVTTTITDADWKLKCYYSK